MLNTDVKIIIWASEVAQKVKALAIKAVDLSSIPRTRVVEAENQTLQAVPDFQMYTHTAQISK